MSHAHLPPHACMRWRPTSAGAPPVPPPQGAPQQQQQHWLERPTCHHAPPRDLKRVSERGRRHSCSRREMQYAARLDAVAHAATVPAPNAAGRRQAGCRPAGACSLTCQRAKHQRRLRVDVLAAWARGQEEGQRQGWSPPASAGRGDRGGLGGSCRSMQQLLAEAHTCGTAPDVLESVKRAQSNRGVRNDAHERSVQPPAPRQAAGSFGEEGGSQEAAK